VSLRYLHHLASIKERYPLLHGQITNRLVRSLPLDDCKRHVMLMGSLRP
jgi:hypothetical protein